jgi:hypothetical protein
MIAVAVPDFTPPRALMFEARTLFFLASWLEQFGEKQDAAWRVHICAVGEPPASVRRLAARAGAGISVHEPLLPAYGGFANKLRGLEAPAGGDGLLLLDADILVHGSLAGLDEIAADLAAARAGKPQVPEVQWRVIYDALHLATPAERIASVYGEHRASFERIARRFPGQEAAAGAMLPYFNSGVLLVRRPRDLREVWEDHLRRIPASFAIQSEAPAHAVANGDQVALATALQALRAKGATFQPLPEIYNARLIHFRTGALRIGDTHLLHAAGFASSIQTREDLPAAVQHYADRLGAAIRQGAGHAAAACAHDLAHIHVFLSHLWHRWVSAEWH